jgi:hypothetical protein
MEQLFGSKTRVKLLKLFMSNPNRSFYVREITRKIEEQINSVRRELANLLSLGLITSDSTDNKLYYEVNQSWEHYPALRELFTGKRAPLKTSAKSDKKTDETPTAEVEITPPAQTKPSVDVKVWDKTGNIAGLVYSGVLTRDETSPVDVMIVGDVPVSRAEAAVAELEKQEGKELRYAVMEIDEWQYRRTVNDKFWLQVMGAKKQVVLDTQNLFDLNIKN